MASAPYAIVVTLLILGSAGTPVPRDDGAAAPARPARPRVPRAERTADTPVIRIGSAPWAAGDVIRRVTTSNSTLHTTIYSAGALVQEFDQFEDRSCDKTIRLLACEPSGPTRMRVDYAAMRFLTRGDGDFGAATNGTGSTGSGSNGSGSNGAGGAPTSAGGAEAIDEKNPLDHHSFLVVRAGRAFRVFDANETRVDEGLAQAVLEEECVRGDEIRRPGDLVAQELCGRTLPIGFEVACSAATSRAFVDGRENLDAASLVLTPREERDEGGRRVAIFDARLAVTDGGDPSQAPTAIDLSGELKLDVATGRFLGVELTGVLSVGESKIDATRGVEVLGTGPWTIRETVAYSRAP